MESVTTRLHELRVWSEQMESLDQPTLVLKQADVSAKLREVVRLKSEVDVVSSEEPSLKDDCQQTINRIRLLRQLSRGIEPKPMPVSTAATADDLGAKLKCDGKANDASETSDAAKDGGETISSLQTDSQQSADNSLPIASTSVHSTETVLAKAGAHASNCASTAAQAQINKTGIVDSAMHASAIEFKSTVENTTKTTMAAEMSTDETVPESKSAETETAATCKKPVVVKQPSRPLCLDGSDCTNDEPKHFYEFTHFNCPRASKMIAKYMRKNGLLTSDDSMDNESKTAASVWSDEDEDCSPRKRRRGAAVDSDEDFDVEKYTRESKMRRPRKKQALDANGVRLVSGKSKSSDSLMSALERKQRLDILLKKTESYMRAITRRIRKKQRAEVKKTGDGEIVSCAEVRSFLAGGNGGDEDKSRTEAIEQTVSLVGGTLKDYQKIGLKWMVTLNQMRLNGILADEMGLGKTVQVLALLAWMRDVQKINGPHLIVVPLSTLSGWKQHILDWTPDLYAYVHSGERSERRGMLRHIRRQDKGYEYNIVLTTYERMVADESDMGRFKWSYLVLDEAHRIKNKESRLFGALNQCSAKYRLLLTGTPLQNNLQELWSLLNFILPEIFDSKQSFEQWFCLPSMQISGGFQTRKNGKKKKVSKVKLEEVITDEERLMIVDRLHRAINPFLLRRTKDDVLPDLARKEEVVLKCPLSGMQFAMYECLQLHGGFRYRHSGKLRQFCNILMKLRKVSNHPLMLFDFEHGLAEGQSLEDGCQLSRDIVAASGKMQVLSHLLPKMLKSDHRILIFFQFLDGMDIVSEWLSMCGIKYVRIDGTMDSDSRVEALGKFDRSQSSLPSLLKIASVPASASSSSVSSSLSTSSAPSREGSASLSASASSSSLGRMNWTRETSTDAMGAGSGYFHSATDSALIGGANADEMLIGGTVNNDEEKKVDVDSDDDIHVFLLSTRSCGLGLNLYSADTVVLFDSDWNPQQDLQAMARVHRIGQTKEVRVFRLIAGSSIEEEIFNRAQSRLDLEKSAIECGQFNFQKEITKEHRKSFLEDVAQKRIELKVFLEQVKQSVTKLTELNRLFARTEAEFELFNQMDAANEWPKLQKERVLPQWLMDATKSTTPPLPSKRKRKHVCYAELDSDDDFLVDHTSQGSEAEAFELATKKRKPKAKAQSKRAVKRKRSEIDDEPLYITSPSAATVKSKKRRI